jgi:hypothetical protein
MNPYRDYPRRNPWPRRGVFLIGVALLCFAFWTVGYTVLMGV